MAEGIIILNNGESILLKKAIAKLLYEKKYEQSKISKILNLTQPMVSNYISSKTIIPKKIEKYLNDIISKIENNQMPNFQACVSFSEIEGNYFIADKNELISDEKQQMIHDLTDAFLLLKGKDITDLLPAIKMNMALCKKNPSDTDDVASFLNGLIITDNKISSINSIQFGKSKHLANLLIYLKTKLPYINSIMNIKYIKKFPPFKTAFLTKDYKLNSDVKDIDILLHKGDFGIEPCAYVLGKNAKEVAKKVIKLI